MKVVFVEPETPGNIGALARVMNNFGEKELILINPQCEVETGETIARAKHAYETVKNARRLESLEDVKKETNQMIGTTGKIPDNYKWERTHLTPKQLRENIKKSKGKNALVLGREGKGLTNKELEICDVVAHIPTNKEYPVMNITHAATVLLYEMHQANKGKDEKDKTDKVPKEKGTLFDYIDQTIDELKEIKKPEETKQIFKRVLNKSFMKKKESYALINTFKEIKEKLK
ncbi:MAG: RNA methyltransferase [archaeon]